MGILKQGALKVTSPFRRWMGTDRIGSDARHIAGLAKDFGSTKTQKGRKESFEQAKKRMNLTEEDIARRTKETYITSWVYFSICLVLLAYTIYLSFKMLILGILLCGVLSVLAGILAIKESFYYMQLKKRKLGCTLGQWFRFVTWRG